MPESGRDRSDQFGRVAALSDRFFVGSSAADTLTTLQRQPGGVLISGAAPCAHDRLTIDTTGTRLAKDGLFVLAAVALALTATELLRRLRPTELLRET